MGVLENAHFQTFYFEGGSGSEKSKKSKCPRTLILNDPCKCDDTFFFFLFGAIDSIIHSYFVCLLISFSFFTALYAVGHERKNVSSH